ncbi:MAG: rod shape-determining protein MreD [Clostridia bacterium]
MKSWKAGIFFLIAFFIQCSFLNVISIAGYTPNLLLCLVIVFSFLYEEQIYGLLYGVLFGVFYDICFADVVGPTPIALVLVALVIFVLREYANIENIVNMWVTSLLSILFYYALNWGLQHLAGNPIGLLYVLKTLPWITLYALSLMTVLYLILLRKMTRHRKDRYFR